MRMDARKWLEGKEVRAEGQSRHLSKCSGQMQTLVSNGNFYASRVYQMPSYGQRSEQVTN